MKMAIFNRKFLFIACFVILALLAPPFAYMATAPAAAFGIDALLDEDELILDIDGESDGETPLDFDDDIGFASDDDAADDSVVSGGDSDGDSPGGTGGASTAPAQGDGGRDHVGLGSISLMPGTYDNGAASPDGLDDGQSGLIDDSDDFNLDDWLAGFDPDADFGGLGFVDEPGPGVVIISVIDHDGVPIDGIVITENGFRTENATRDGRPCEIVRVPYGERVFGIFLPYSFEIESASMAFYTSADGDTFEATPVDIDDAENMPPVNITDETARWEIVFVLRQSMKINVSYFLVSPNDRFYMLRQRRTPEGEISGYYINTFEFAPVRSAVYIEMPAIRDVVSIRLEGAGFVDEYGVTGSVSAAADDVQAWVIERERGDFALLDWTIADRSWQLLSSVSGIGPDDAAFIRFFVLSMPSAFDGALLRFDRIVLTLDDGSETAFDNPSVSELTVNIVNAPGLL